MTINMKKIIVHVSAFIFSFGNVFANAECTEIFPLSGITVGMKVEDLIKQYPPELYNFKKEPHDPEEDFIAYEIPTNRFWDSLTILIGEDSTIEYLGYFYGNNSLFLQNPDARNYDKIINNIKPLFKQLKKELGSGFEKKVIYIEEKTRCAMYVWKRENDFVAFTHSPVFEYKQGDHFFCQLTIAPTLEVLEMYNRMATDSLPEDELLWADAMDEEEKGTFPNLWVCASITLCAFGAIAYLIWRKRQ